MNKILDEINDLKIDLSEYDVEELNDFEKQDIKKRVNMKLTKNKNGGKRKIAIIAASIGICMLIGFSSPAMANIKSFVFGILGGEGSGIENAESNGYIQNIDDVIFADDKLDIRLTNVMVDSSKIALDYEIKFKDDSIKLDDKIDKEKDLGYGVSIANISLYDENGNIIYKDGITGIVDGNYSKFEVNSEDNKKGHYKVIFYSQEAGIPKIDKLNIEFNEFKFSNNKNEVILNENLNWACNVNLNEKFKTYKTLEYMWTDSENIKVNKAISLPTGINLKFIYSAKGHDPINDIMEINLVTEDGVKIKAAGSSVEDGREGDKYNISFNEITSFENAEKFTLEIKNPDGVTIDKVNFTK